MFQKNMLRYSVKIIILSNDVTKTVSVLIKSITENDI